MDAIERLTRAGAARFSGWRPDLFAAYCRHVGPTTPAFYELLAEGVGCGYLVAPPDAPAENLMEHCLRSWLPGRLTPSGQAALLAEAWNLLEGLLREPRWVNAYVLARAAELDRAAGLKEFLTHVLTPLFEPADASRWQGPFRVTTLSLRPGDDDFLPGDMRLVAPTVLSVQDRRRPVRWGVLLRKDGRSELAGAFGEAAAFAEGPPAAVPRWQGEELHFPAGRVTLPFLGEPFRWLQAGAGFVVASAVHSQKLWIVESAA